MPIYEYRCEACGHELEVLQKVSDPPLTKCPECGEERLKKKISMTTFRLKGTGWYETDFKKRDGKKRFLADSGEKEKKSEKSESKKSESTSTPD